MAAFHKLRYALYNSISEGRKGQYLNFTGHEINRLKIHCLGWSFYSVILLIIKISLKQYVVL